MRSEIDSQNRVHHFCETPEEYQRAQFWMGTHSRTTILHQCYDFPEEGTPRAELLDATRERLAMQPPHNPITRAWVDETAAEINPENLHRAIAAMREREEREASAITRERLVMQTPHNPITWTHAPIHEVDPVALTRAQNNARGGHTLSSFWGRMRDNIMGHSFERNPDPEADDRVHIASVPHIGITPQAPTKYEFVDMDTGVTLNDLRLSGL